MGSAHASIPVQAPAHPVNTDPVSGMGVRVTVVPNEYDVPHGCACVVDPPAQVRPVAVTPPVPDPCRSIVSCVVGRSTYKLVATACQTPVRLLRAYTAIR